MINSKKQNYIFYPLLCVFAIFACLAHIHQAFQILLYTIVIIAPLLFDDTKTISVYFFSVCYMGCFGHGMFLAMLNISLFVLEIKKLTTALITKQNKKEIVTVLSVWFILLLVLTLYSVIYNHFKIYRMGMFIDFVQCAIVCYLVRKSINIKHIVFTLFAGLLVSASSAIMFSICDIANPHIAGRWGSRYGAFFNNVNGLSVYCTACASAFIILLLTNHLPFKRFCYLPFICTFIGLLPYSKAFVLTSLILYGIWFVLSFAKSDKKKKYIIYFILLLVTAGIISFLARDYIQTIISRFSGSKTASKLDQLTTGRGRIWSRYFDLFTKSPITILFGNGYTAPKIASDNYEHSIYLAFLYQFGIVGTIIIISTLIWTLRKGSKLQKNLDCYITLTLLMFNGLVSNLSGVLCSCLIWFLAFYFVTFDKNIETQNIKNTKQSIPNEIDSSKEN